MKARRMLMLRGMLVLLAVLMVPRPAVQAQASVTTSIDPRILKLVDSVSEERLHQLLEKLVSFGTRNTLSDTASSTRGIGAARQWIFDELKRTSPRLQVSFDTHLIPAKGRITRDVELRNVMAVLPGKSERRIYVSGHYDSLNLGPRGQQAGNAGAGRGGRPRGAESCDPAGRRARRRRESRPLPPGIRSSVPDRTTTSTPPAPTTMAAGRCCRWNWRACSRKAASNSTRRSSS